MTEPENIDNTLELIESVTASRYIDPKTDFAFKHFFGKEPHKDLLIKFLNSLFKGRKVIVDIQYNNIEQKGILKSYRKTVFDLYCTGDQGEKFIIELQRINQNYFKDRVIFYSANLIQEQGISVNTDWSYELPEVYFIALVNFALPDSPADQYFHDVRLMEVNTNRQFYDKLNYLFVEIPKFQKTEDQLETDQDYWLYMLKNLPSFNEIPVTLSEKEEFVKFFQIAEVSNLTQEDMDAYQQNLKIQRDNYSALETAENRGIAKGKAEGKAEGEYNKALEIATILKQKGFDLKVIAESTNLSIEEIEAII